MLFLTISLSYASVESVDTHVDPNNPPDVGTETTVINTNPPKLSSKRNTLVILILLVVIIAVVSTAVVLYRSSQPQKSDNATTPSSQIPKVDLKASYQNPFNKSAQYENPFENLK